jgi:chitinase
MTLTSKALLAALLFAATLPTLHAANPRLLAYYGYWDRWNTPTYDASNIPYNQLTHIVHDSIGPASAADGTLSIPPGFLEPELISRAHAAGVKVEICISGNSALFVTIDADAQLRATFAQNIANFAIANGYDGVDFDYEVPSDAAQASQFTSLIQDLRGLMPAGQYLISAAVSSSPGSYGVYDFPGMTPLLDFYNVMTYDFHGPWTNHSGHNSPLYLSPIDPGQEGSLNTSTISYTTQFNVPAEQINLGTAFYGYAFNVDGLWTLCTDDAYCGNFGVPTVTYMQVEQLIASGAWTENFDDLAQAPYLLNPVDASFGFVTYDSPSSTAAKVTYAVSQHNLGGVFMWELSQDYNGHNQPLLSAMHSALVHAAESKH